jgi:hypothetical protein
MHLSSGSGSNLLKRLPLPGLVDELQQQLTGQKVVEGICLS